MAALDLSRYPPARWLRPNHPLRPAKSAALHAPRKDTELKRGYGLNRSRYRGEAKNQLQAYLIGAACNLKRWSRRLLWEGRKEDLGGESTLLGAVWDQLKAFAALFCFPRAASPLQPRLLYGAP